MWIAFWRNESAATSIEYVVVACAISIAIVLAARTIGVNLDANYYVKVSNGFS